VARGGLTASKKARSRCLFEHILKQIKQAGELGQFRTPRHIIRAIVAMLDPKAGKTVYDPAAGTAGFLVAAFNHIRLANSAHVEEVEQDGKRVPRGHGERLTAAQWSALNNATFYGNDVDPKMVHLATMNLTLRGLANVRILKRNVLTTTLDREQKAALGLRMITGWCWQIRRSAAGWTRTALSTR
jgi:type I restriction enzyme M protein